MVAHSRLTYRLGTLATVALAIVLLLLSTAVARPTSRPAATKGHIRTAVTSGHQAPARCASKSRSRSAKKACRHAKTRAPKTSRPHAPAKAKPTAALPSLLGSIGPAGVDNSLPALTGSPTGPESPPAPGSPGGSKPTPPTSESPPSLTEPPPTSEPPPAPEPSFYAPHPGTVFSGPGSVWNTSELANHEVDASSETLVSTLSYWGSHNINGINTTSYSSPIYTVPANQPTTKVILDASSPPLNAALQAVPIPPSASVAPGTDEHMVVYQPTTNQMWEFWHMREGLLPPTTASFVVTTSSGGHLAAGSYYYRVTALSAAGETTPSEAFSVTVPESDSVVSLSFKGVIYGQGYKIYRGTEANNVGYVGTVPEATNVYGTTVTFVDSGATVPAGSAPTVNTAATPGQWHAGWAGRIADVSSDPGYFRLVHPVGSPVLEEPDWGSTASSLPIADGMITLGDLEQGHIDHALQLLVPTARAVVHSFPAQRTDGGETTTTSIPEGAHFVLSSTVDCSLQATPFMRMVCVAAQTYGLIVNDQTGGGLALRGEDPGPLIRTGGADPYPRYFTDASGREWRPYQMMAAFPWSSLRLLPMQLETQAQSHA
jgi:hypothetical protein